MSILTRPLTDAELKSAGIEPAPIAHETFTQVFAVHDGELEIVDQATDEVVEDDETPPPPTRIGLAVWAWAITFGGAVGALVYAAEVSS
ncbi:hypothetical protein M1M07_24645 [Rhodococcus sp. HM1]|uniref:hypothetical protein n=1 Tax=Rhodococcus sp. HM1 TaxID=2937759 RepID=UPI00200B9AFE|nr:hypothetical protein [Rhodococcus sp. HM1]MCK8674289.1 hypothetical protein [Rhodococcus sp. HM1]